MCLFKYQSQPAPFHSLGLHMGGEKTGSRGDRRGGERGCSFPPALLRFAKYQSTGLLRTFFYFPAHPPCPPISPKSLDSRNTDLVPILCWYWAGDHPYLTSLSPHHDPVRQVVLVPLFHKGHSIGLPKVTAFVLSRAVLSNTVATSHMWFLTTQNVARMN